MSRNVPVSAELVIVRDGKVLLVKREWYGEHAYHTPGSYISPGETFLQAAQRIADLELKVRVRRAEQFGPPLNHPTNPRFHDLSVLVRCEIEDEPAVGEWFGPDERPEMLDVQSEYWAQIEPLLRKAVIEQKGESIV